jgi:murein DD-endopeptidase MepM/ murein hydrolase activator NlpD
MRFKFILILIIFSSFFFINQQSSKNEIDKRKKELETLRKQIKEYESKLNVSEKKEKSTMDLIDKYDKQGMLLNQLINKITDEIVSNENDAKKIEGELKLAELKLSQLKNDYAKYIISIYKRGKARDLELVFSSSSLNQMYIRLEYLKRFTINRIEELKRIEAQKDTIDFKVLSLKEKIDEKKLLLDDKKHEETNMKKLIGQKKTALVDIKKDQKNIKSELERRNRAAKDVELMISKLITEDIKKQEATKKTTQKKPTPTKPTASKTGFGIKQGNLIWPVSGKVVSKFGNQVHPSLKTVTLNYGIDIAVPNGTNVKAVANGEVAVIYFVAGFGNVIIISHVDGLRTVYAHLSQIMVKEGDTVKEGQIIAKSGESVSGEVLHFQIWKNRDQQNPELWLTSK